MTLSPEHREKLRKSALSDAQIDALDWSSLHNGRLLIPYLKPDGSPEQRHDGKPFARERLSDAEIAELKRQGNRNPGKYRSPKDNGCRIYHSRLAIQKGRYAERLADRFVPLRITEGELKVEAATVHDPKRVTIGLGGVHSWQDRYDGGDESRPLVDWDEIPLQGREVRLCFDSDLDKPQVAAALRDLAEFLASKGAHVLVEVLPHGLDGKRLGIDDLIYRHGPELFHRIARIGRSPLKTRRQDGKDVQVWAFNPEPQDTHQRNVYLSGMLGPHWRRSPDGRDRWQHWIGTHWVEVAGDDQITAAIEAFMELQGCCNRELNTIRSLQAAFRRSIAAASEHDTPDLIPFRNGVLVLADMHLVPHRPEHGNSWSLPYDYNPAARCPQIEAFLLDRLGDPDSVAVFRAFCLFLLLGKPLKCFLELYGPGNTGKSVIERILIALVGSENHAASKLHRLEDPSQRFETLNLRGKRLAVFSECQDYGGQLQTLKALTGGDPIAAEVKGGRHLAFTFTGGVVLVGNGPIRASDPTGAVINRRRSLRVTKVVAASNERKLLEPDGRGGWEGALAPELPGLVNWALAMPEAEARQALARDVQSIARAEAELSTLLATDLLAAWADEHLVWAPGDRLRVGTTESEADGFLFASYLRFMDQQGRNTKPLSGKVFKAKLIDLLRDTLGLPLPPGDGSSGEYKARGLGSVVPCLRWRQADEEAPGVIRHGFLARISTPTTGTDEQSPGTGRERVGNGKTPVGNGWNGFLEVGFVKGSAPHEPPGPSTPVSPYAATECPEPVPPVPSVPQKGFAVSAPVPEGAVCRSAPPNPSEEPSIADQPGPHDPGRQRQGVPITVDGGPGWWLPSGVMPKGHGPTVPVLCIDPEGRSLPIERRRIELCVPA